MRLPQRSESGADIDMEQCKKMVDLFLEREFTYFDTSYAYHNGASETAKIGGAFDVDAALREAVKIQYGNSFPSYMD